MKQLKILILIFLISGCAALEDPHVHVPLIAAGVIHVADLDKARTTSVFGSAASARDASDNFRAYTQAAAMLTAMNDPVLLIEQTALIELSGGIVSNLKVDVGRERPDKSDSLSFPSGHTAAALTRARMAQRNQPTIQWDILAGLTAFARVESGRHYPTDVLFSWALGSAISHIDLTPRDGMIFVPYLDLDEAGVYFIRSF